MPRKKDDEPKKAGTDKKKSEVPKKTGASKRTTNKKETDSAHNAGGQSAGGEKPTSEFLPEDKSLKNLKEASKSCEGCDLYKNATQTVFGDGNAHARVMLVGEQPGDVEDKEGEPFVGPAGKLLHKALIEAGIPDDACYVTNAVKHFKFEWRGKRRIHAKPRRIEVLACLPWLQAEIETVKPDVIVCLGATAAQALLGPNFRVTKQRGELLRTGLAKHVLATVHPSSILRAPDDETRHEEMQKFIDDLKVVADLLDDL